MHATRRGTARITMLLGAAALVSACADDPGVVTPPLEPRAEAAIAVQEIQLQSLARATALALADDRVRQSVLEDLRDSPFPQHRIHLRSYFSVGDLGLAVARELGVNRAGIAAALAGLPDLELLMRLKLDRARWSGTPDVVVIATTRTASAMAQDLFLTAFATDGSARELHAYSEHAFPALVIARAGVGWGDDPEARRRAAPRQARNTVSTRAEEFPVTILGDEIPCFDEFGNPIPCDEPPPPNPMASYRLASGYAMSDCYPGSALPAGSDLDADGVLDNCEYEVAYRFRPYLSLSPNDAARFREPYWAVKYEGGALRIFYALAYYEDAGSATGGFSAHPGDSEFIILTVQNTWSNVWEVWSVTMSAHWNTFGDSSETLGWGDSRWTWPDGQRGRPLVWVAKNKHANYVSRYVCDAGAYYFDTCDDNIFQKGSQADEVAVLGNSTANIGNYWIQTKNCVGSRMGWPGIECLWTDSWFDGWQNAAPGEGAGGYINSLWAFGF